MKYRLWERPGDRGSAAMELVLVAPLLVLVMLVVVALGRLADARLVVVDAAHQAARAASLARTKAAARTDAQRAVEAALQGVGKACTQPRVALTTSGLTPGSSTAVTLSCTADLGDLTHTGVPGSATLTSTAYSPVDTYRGTP